MNLNLREFICSVGIFVLGQILFTALVYSSVIGFKNSSQLQTQLLNASQLSAKINLNADFGRDIYNIPTLEHDLLNIISQSQTTAGAVVDSKGDKLCSYGIDFDTVNIENIKNGSFENDGILYAVSPTLKEEQISGYVLIALNDADNKSQQLQIFFDTLLKISVLSFVIFALFYCILVKFNGFSFIKKSYIFLVSFLICQIFSALLSFNSIKPMVESFTGSMEYYSSESLSNDLRRVHTLGVDFKDISGLSSYFDKIKNTVDSVGHIALTDKNAQIITGDTEAFDGVRRPIMNNGMIAGFSWLKVNDSFIEKTYIKLVIDFLTLIVISTIFANELKSLLGFEMNHIAQRKETSKVPFEPLMIRPLSFILIFGMFLTLTLIPLRISMLQTSFFNVDKNVLMSLPVTTEMVAIGIASFILLFYSSKLGSWKKVLPTGILTVALAAFVSGIATDALTYLSGRFIYGFGYGFVLLGCQLYVMNNTTAQNRGASLSSFSAGSFSGILCGCAAGGMIAERVNIQTAFYISSFISSIVFGYFMYLIATRVDVIKSKSSSGVLKITQIISYLKNKEVITFLVFQVIPYSALAIGIFNFFLPVLIAREGYSLSVAGQINILYSCTVVFLAPVFGRLLDKSDNKYWILGAGLVFSAMAPLVLNLDHALIAAIVTVLMLGVSASINDAGQVTYISTLKSSQIFGPNESVILLDAIYRIGQIIGPSIIAVGIAISADSSLYVIAALAFISAVTFVMFNIGNKNAVSS